MGVCSVIDCTGKDHPHHCFPNTNALKSKWEEQLNKQNFTANENSRVCEKHFSEDSFLPAHLNVNKRGEKLKRKHLKPQAYPTLFLNPKKQRLSNHVVEQELNDKIQEQARQIEELKRQNLELTESRKNEEKENQETIKSLKKEALKYDVLKEKLEEIWNPDQIERVLGPPHSHPPWYEKTLEGCMKTMARCGGQGYEYLKDELKLPMVPRRTCQRHLAKIDSEPGPLLHDIMRMLSRKAEKMTPEERLCCLNIDEMTLKAKYQYDSATQQYYGHITVPLSEKMQAKRIKETGKYDEKMEFAHHALNAMIVGLSTFWKQLIAYHFTGNSYCAKTVAKWIVDLIRAISSINLRCMVVSMDSGPLNVAV